MSISLPPVPAESADLENEFWTLLDTLKRQWALLLGATVLAGAVGLGSTYLIAPTFTASTTLLPPQQGQSATAAALASLGSLAGLATGGAVRTPADQYVSLLQSVTVSDRLLDRFDLIKVYDSKFRVDARRALLDSVRMGVGKKDGLLVIEVEDKDPQRAADIANAYVEELRRMVGLFAVTEAQQRRLFFEQQMGTARDRLAAAQAALQGAGFNQGALKAEPRAAADSYARLRAEITAAEVRLQSLRASLLDQVPEVQTQQATLSALRSQLARLEASSSPDAGSDFIGKYREFKYQETLFELFARQFEMARVDESRDGALIQVIDAATPPEKRSRPKRTATALLSALGTAAFILAWLVLRHSQRRTRLTRSP